MITDELGFMKAKVLGASAITLNHRRLTYRIKGIVFHITSAIIADAKSQQFHMKTEDRRSSPMNYDLFHDLMKNQALHETTNNYFWLR